jgi:GDP-mannose transporter
MIDELIYCCRYTGWLCRGMVSATTFTLVGVVNKLLTVLINVMLWDKHSTPFGIASVCVCLLAGSFYQQSPRREEGLKVDKDTESQMPMIKK